MSSFFGLVSFSFNLPNNIQFRPSQVIIKLFFSLLFLALVLSSDVSQFVIVVDDFIIFLFHFLSYATVITSSLKRIFLFVCLQVVQTSKYKEDDRAAVKKKGTCCQTRNISSQHTLTQSSKVVMSGLITK